LSKEASGSFFEKKEPKKLFEICFGAAAAERPMPQVNKSFLLLFFKKEVLS